ncbi:MAG: hypothetical protein ACE5HS_15960 [bacterium]
MRNSIRFILTIAAVERTMLYRTAKFWILACIGIGMILLFLIGTTVATILADDIPGEFLLEGTDAYLALYIFSYLQAILVIFVAGDFRKAEEKARLDQVMLSKPMTTANWVLGKYLGVVSALLYLNIFLMLLATAGRIMKMIFTDTGFNVLPFIEYFVVATVPAILFMTALVFFLVSLLRVQFMAIILAGGYVASIWFYFHHKFSGLLDYAGFFAPLFWSDLIGFGDIRIVLWQRLFFVLLALSLLGFSVLLYPRLRQSVWSHRLTQVLAFSFLFAATGVGYGLVQQSKKIMAARQTDLAFQKDWRAKPACRVSHYDFYIKFSDERDPLQVTAKMAVTNPHNQPLAELVFSLNSGLRVQQVRWHDGQAISHVHSNQLLQLDMADRPLPPNSVDTMVVVYAGKIDADGFMLDRLPDQKGLIDKTNGPWTQGNISAWLSRDFAVLPAQCGWYPVPGAAAGYDFAAENSKNFTTAVVLVQTQPDLSVITQGTKVSETESGAKKVWRFEVTTPVPGFSLNIGKYKRLAHSFKHMEIQLYFREKHLLDYEEFADVADTCFEAVDRIFDLFEEVTGAIYPYEKLVVVEVPLQMQVYPTRHGLNNILQQPGVIWIDEVTVASKRIAKVIESKTKRARKRGRDDSPKKIKRDVFIELVLDIFLSDRLWRRDSTLISPIPNYLHFQLDFADPVLRRGLELQLYESCERKIRDLFYPDRWNAALSSFDRMRQNEWRWATRRRYHVEIDTIIVKLSKWPLTSLRPETDGNVYRACVDYKAPPVLQMMQERIGENNYLQALKKLLKEKRYQRVSREDFLRTVQSAASVDVQDFFRQWFDQATFPGYRITKAEAEKLDTGKMKIVYQVTARVQNGERGDGFVRLVCETKNDKIRRNLPLGSYEEKEILLALTDLPKTIEVVPYFSRNRGKIKKQITLANRIKRETPRDTVLTVQSVTDSMFFVLDDQDDGFFTPVNPETKYLRPPSKGKSWWENTNPFAYGKYYFGWRMKRAGDGDYPARWETRVPRDGEYELSFYFNAGESWVKRNLSQTFQMNITSADGKFPYEFQPQETVDGWYPLGRYYFTQNKPAVVELEDVGKGFLIADAIRWEYVP